MLRWFYWYPFRILLQQIPITFAYKIAGLIVPVYYYFAKGKRGIIAQHGLITMYEGKLFRKEIDTIGKDTFLLPMKVEEI